MASPAWVDYARSMRAVLSHPGTWIGLAAWGAVFGLGLIVTPVWPTAALAAVAGFALIFAALAGVVLAGGAGAAVAGADWRLTGLLVVVGGGLIAGGAQLDDAPSALLIGAGLLLAGNALGARLGREVQAASYLWPLVVVALGADIWSVTTPEGVTHQMVEDGLPPGVPLIILSLPVPGVGLSPVLGIGDVLFCGLLLGAVARLELSMKRALLGLAIGYGACLVGLVILASPIPALPFLGVAGVAALGRSAAPVPKELGMAILFVGGFFLVRFVVL